MNNLIKNIVTGVLIAIFSSTIGGGLWLYTDYKITKGKQEVINSNLEAINKANLKIYRNSVAYFKEAIIRLDSNSVANIRQHKQLFKEIKDLSNDIGALRYVIIKGNSKVGKQLEELKMNGLWVSVE